MQERGKMGRKEGGKERKWNGVKEGKRKLRNERGKRGGKEEGRERVMEGVKKGDICTFFLFALACV